MYVCIYTYIYVRWGGTTLVSAHRLKYISCRFFSFFLFIFFLEKICPSNPFWQLKYFNNSVTFFFSFFPSLLKKKKKKKKKKFFFS